MSIFPSYFFKSILCEKTGEVYGGELLLKNGTIDGYAYKTCYSRAGFTLRRAPGNLGIFATSSCQIQNKTKKSPAM